MEQTIAVASLIISLAAISISAANEPVKPTPADKAIIQSNQANSSLTAEEQTDYQFVRSNTTPTNPQPQEQTK